MLRISLFLSILFLASGGAQALPSGCSALASTVGGDDLWIVPADLTPRHVLSDRRGITAGAWSPDGQQIAFSTFTRDTTLAPEIIVAAPSGRIVSRFAVDRPQGEGSLRYINDLVWSGQQTFVTLGNMGPHGGFMDVWRTDKGYTRAERVRRSNSLLFPCQVSPSTRYVACNDGFWIRIIDTLAGPPDEEKVMEDKHPFEIASYGREDDPSEGAGNLAWGIDDLRLYTVRRLRSKLLLTTVERDPSAAEGWTVTDRSLAGIETSGGVAVEVDAHGGLTLSDDRQAYVLDGGTSSGRRDVVARAIPATALRRPRELDVRSDSGTLHLTVLDTYCGRR